MFKFLAEHSEESLPSGFKRRVQKAIRGGDAVSVALTLCTRSHMGSEKFITHWTPLKNEKEAVGWVVVTLGSTGDD